MWKTGIMFYVLSGPFVFMTFALFYTTRLKEDMFCTLANFGYDDAKILENPDLFKVDTNSPYSADVQIIHKCLKDEDRYNGEFKDHAAWRWPIF